MNTYKSSKTSRVRTRAQLARLLSAAALTIFASTLISSCVPGKKKQQPGSTGQLVIISPHWEGIRAEFAAAFEKWYLDKTGKKITVKWVDQGGATDDLKYIKSAFSKTPGGINIDLFFGGGIDPYVDLASLGLLQPAGLQQELTKTIPPHLNGVPLNDHDNGLWFGNALSGFGIMSNKEMAQTLKLPEVRTWTDLADPGLIGQIELGDPRHSSSSHVLFEIILQRYGWEKGWSLLASIAANARALPESSSQVPQDVAAGQAAYGLVIDAYAYSAIDQHGAAKISFVMPRDATVITPDPIAVLKGAPNADAAKQFVAFTLSPEAQKLWLYKKGAPGGPAKFSLNKMSILPASYKDAAANSNITVNPFEYEGSFTYDFKKGTARWEVVNDIAGAMLIDNHDNLLTLWRARTMHTAPGTKIADFFKPPVSEQEALELATTGWKDPVFRNRMVSSWRQAKK